MSNSAHDLLGKGAKVTIMPDEVRSEEWNTFRIVLTVGEEGLDPEDSMGLVCGSNIDRWQFHFASSIWGQFTPFQVGDPAAPNYVSASCSRENVELSLEVGCGGPLKSFHNQPDHIIKALRHRYRYVLEISPDRKLVNGDSIELVWGDRRFGCPGVQAPAIAMRYHFFPFKFSRLPRYDRELSFRKGRFSSMPTIRVTGQEASSFHVTAPALAGRDVDFPVRITALDKYGNRDCQYNGPVCIDTINGASGEERVIQLRKSDRGSCTVEGFSLSRAGWTSIQAVSPDREVRGESNAILCSEEKPDQQIFWGAMHGHTLDCDGILSAKDQYEYAGEVAHLDFASCASHAEYFGCREAWDKYLEEAEKAGEKSNFVTFYGYEWAGEGHINGYFLNKEDVVNIYGKNILKGEHPPDESDFRIPATEEGEFLQKFKELPGKRMAISHFHSRYGPDIDDDILRLHEIYSMHQQNPREEKYRGILECGYKIGVVGGSDTHRWGMGHLCADPDLVWNQPECIDGEVGSQSIQKKCGLQGTFAEEKTPESIWKAMEARYTYGTTGARIVLLFHINGREMGKIIDVEEGDVLDFDVKVGGTKELREVMVVKFDGLSWSEPFKKLNCGGRFLDISWKDTAEPGSLYFIRAVQEDGETAWSSPVWIVS